MVIPVNGLQRSGASCRSSAFCLESFSGRLAPMSDRLTDGNPSSRFTEKEPHFIVTEPMETTGGEPKAVHPMKRSTDSNPNKRPCACKARCGDVAEKDDHPRAICKGLPGEKKPLVELVLWHR